MRFLLIFPLIAFLVISLPCKATFKISTAIGVNSPVYSSNMDNSSLDEAISEARHLKNNKDLLNKKSQHINVNFFNHLPPYIIQNSKFNGILLDIVKQTFSHSDLTLSQVFYSRYRALDEVMTNNANVDATIINNKNNSNFYYSDQLIQLNNIVLSKKTNTFNFQTIDDLKQRHVIGYKGANLKLNTPFTFNVNTTKSGSNSYREFNSKLQIQALVNNDADAIIIDKGIAIWELAQLKSSSINDFNVNELFPHPSPLYLAFRHQSVAKEFNKQFRQLKKQGIINDIIDDNLTQRIKYQQYLQGLFSYILSQSLYSNDQFTLEENLLVIDHLKVVNAIEVTSLKGKKTSPMLKSFSAKTMISSIHFDNKNTIERVGSMSIVFDNDAIDNAIKNNQLRPSLATFKFQKNFEYIKKIYQNLNNSTDSIQWTENEKKYIKHHNEVTYSEVNWEPLISIKGNKMSGFIADYLSLISKKSGLTFNLIPSDDWDGVKDKFNSRETMIIPSVDYDMPPHLLSVPYTEFNYAIITKKDDNYYNSVHELKNKSIVVVGNSTPIINTLLKRFPTIKIVKSPTIQAAILQVRLGKVDVYLGHIATAMHYVQNKFPDLKIAGITDFKSVFVKLVVAITMLCTLNFDDFSFRV